ncbi:MAG: type II toxin-antitoxin system HicA family toxin [Planctomycetia bacterium]|nr:type II toxin-antitoxin system HicA family toxin [Planctomycetia bacterium]
MSAPQLPASRAKRVLGALQELGFVVVRQHGSHKFLRHPDGRVCTFAFHDKATIGRAMLSKLAHQAGVNSEDLGRLLG